MEQQQSRIETLIEIGHAIERVSSEEARNARECNPQRGFREKWLRSRGMTDAEVEMWADIFMNMHSNDGDFFGRRLYDVGKDGLTDYERDNLAAIGSKYGVKTK